MTSFTVTGTITFTRSHAEYMAAKVATDLQRIQRLYGEPSNSWISNYYIELIELLAAEYLGEVTYGFQRNGTWIEPTLRYNPRNLSDASMTNDDPGKIRIGADISKASFCSYLIYSRAWDSLNEVQRNEFRKRIPFSRTSAQEPGVNGYFTGDLTYAAGARALDRSILRGYL